MNVREFFGNHPLLMWLIIGMLLRLLLAPLLTRSFDVASWGEIMENIRAGEGLYDVKGYYYTPLWGYFLNVAAIVSAFFPGLDTLATTADVTYLEYFFDHDTRIPTLGFAIFIKIPLILFDAAVAYALYELMKLVTDDEKKAVRIFAAWMIIVPAIMVSSVAGMFDNLSVLLLLLSMFCLFLRKNAAAGVLLGLGAMLKIYPGLAIVPMTCYIIAVNSDRTERIRKCASLWVSAAITAVIVIIPPVMKGQIEQVFYLLTSRLRDYGSSSTVTVNGILLLCAIIALVIVSIAIYRFLQKHYGNPEKAFIGTLCVLIGLAVTITYNIQYVVEVLPLILLMFVAYGVGSKRLLILFSALYAVYFIGELPVLLLALEEAVTWFPLDVLEGLAKAINNGWLMELLLMYVRSAHQIIIGIFSLIILYDAIFGRVMPWELSSRIVGRSHDDS